jgi:tRNA threonylcarbamoyladenosine biosynthesis protein TsaB
MNILAIDTSTEQASVALLVHGKVTCEEKRGLRQHAQWILPMIQQLLAEADVSLNALDGVAFGCGPGSFTGLRVACSVAKGLAYAHDLPLFPVSSLFAIADEVYYTESGLAKDTPVLALLDARMQQVYWGCFKEGRLQGEEQVSSPSTLQLPSSPLIVAGVGLETILPLLPPATIIKHCEIFPRATAMIRLVQQDKIQACDVASALPIYIRNQVTQGERSHG